MPPSTPSNSQMTFEHRWSETMERVELICSLCGQHAGYNTPARREDTDEIVCPRCIDQGKPEGVLCVGVDQRTGLREDLSNDHYYLDGIMVHEAGRGFPRFAWTHGGHHAYQLTRDEAVMPVLALIQKIKNLYDNGKYRCSRCGDKFNWPPAGYPLFSGIACEKCWAAHQAALKEERHEGHVCTRCREPYGNCCC